MKKRRIFWATLLLLGITLAALAVPTSRYVADALPAGTLAAAT